MDSCSNYTCTVSPKMELRRTGCHPSVGYGCLVHLSFSILSEMSLVHMFLQFAVNYNLRSSLDNFVQQKISIGYKAQSTFIVDALSNILRTFEF